MGVKLQFISNNFKGLQKCLKRIKIFEYFKTNLGYKGFLFLQETHSAILQETHTADEKKWADGLKGLIFFSHGKTNSSGVVIGYIGNNKVVVLDKKIDKNRHILMLDAMVDGSNFILYL